MIENIFRGVKSLAQDIGMFVNGKKTQLLCIHANTANEVSSYIRDTENEIISTQNLKLLGFNFNSEPNANHHVTGLINKFYSKLWTLRFLKRSGMSSSNLLGIYSSTIRPSVEYASIIYHSLIPEYLSNKLEQVQKQAIKIILGHNIDYASLIDGGELETLR